MSPRVLRQMIGSHKPPHANWTLEGLLASVDLSVAAELVGAGEPLAAIFPSAVIRALPAVRAQMRCEMGLLFVGLAAAGLGTLVRPEA